MKYIKDISMILLISALIIFLGSMGRYFVAKSAEHETARDTITFTLYDTVPFYKPIPKDSLVIRYITEKLPNVSDKEDCFPIIDDKSCDRCDSSNVAIPITQQTYTDDSTYIAWVSGYNAALDSFMFIRKTKIISTPSPAQPKERKWHVGIQVGYGVTVKNTPQFTPYIGVGLSYKLFGF